MTADRTPADTVREALGLIADVTALPLVLADHVKVVGAITDASVALDALLADLAAANERADEAESRLKNAQGIYDAMLLREQALEEQLAAACEALHEWRYGSDWQGEGSGQMPDRVALLRIEELLAASGAPPQPPEAEDTP